MLNEIGKNAKKASVLLSKLPTTEKDLALEKVAESLLKNSSRIIKANKLDLEKAIENGISGALLDRLTLNEDRVSSMAQGLLDLTNLEDPIGEVISMKKQKNGLIIGQKRVPIGVIGIIYEARPNVTVDGFGLCLKTGNAVILKGGKEAINSNIEIINIIRETLEEIGVTKDAVQLIENTDRETTTKFMKLSEYLDVLIPRGGRGLIKAVVENSSVPVIETGAGNCHIYIDEKCNIEDALNIVENAKVQRPGVCNSAEHVLINENILDSIGKRLYDRLKENNVLVKGDELFRKIIPEAEITTEEDWETEYHDYIISIKVVSNVDEAISHINKYSTGHSEAIITDVYQSSQKFLEEIDSAAVYINASTRFTDGSAFGFGAEIGISTQKLHARGPMGIKELTSTKYIIYGDGQIRK